MRKGFGRVFRHAYHIGGVHYLHGGRGKSGHMDQRLKYFAVTHQNQLHISGKEICGQQYAFYKGLGGKIATHCVYRNSHVDFNELVKK